MVNITWFLLTDVAANKKVEKAHNGGYDRTTEIQSFPDDLPFITLYRFKVPLLLKAVRVTFKTVPLL